MIRVRDLRFRYPGSAQDALRGLDFEVARGEVFGLLGPSGTGKSTVVGVLTGALGGYRGEVSVLNAPGPADRERRAHIGVGFEVPSLYTRLTARENLELFAALHRAARPDVEGLLAEVGLAGEADRRVEHFSKGMRGRLDLCRARLGNPALLFLDEPTAALDPGYARLVRDLIRRFADAGGAVLLTTHDMHVAEAICDRVGLLVDGRFVACDRPQRLRETSGPPEVRLEVAPPHGADAPPVVHVRALTALADDPEVQGWLRGGQVRTLHTCEPTLEDVFLARTGRSLT